MVHSESIQECQRELMDEETPLLRPGRDHKNANDCYESTVSSSSSSTIEVSDEPDDTKTETPLDWWQFSLVLFLQLAESLTSQVIYPFVPQLIRELGITNGDDTKVGYYVGMMQSIFFATQGLTVLNWSRLSDKFGRKPIILTGFFGLSLSMYCFGLSRTFIGLVISRSLNGALNGNIGVIKSIMGELTDETNIAKAFAWQPLPWSTGATIGPLIGGALSHPAERFPSLFGSNEFLRAYPYFLPCAIPATFTVFCWLITYFFLKETNPRGFSLFSLFRSKKNQHTFSKETPLLTSPPESPPLLSLLTPRTVLSAGCYALLSLLDIAYRALQPVFYATPARLGGLGLEPHEIGLWLSILGAANGLFQALMFPRMCGRWGVRGVYIVGIASAVPIFALFPVMSVLVGMQYRHDGENAESVIMGGFLPLVISLALSSQLALTLLLNACYSASFIYITASAPRSSLGAVNGLAQTSVSFVRCLGPAFASSLFARCLKWQYEEGRGVVWGWSVYGLMMIVVGVALVVGRRLPEKPWKREEIEAEWEQKGISVRR